MSRASVVTRGIEGVVVFAALLGLFAAVSSDLGVTWDESTYMRFSNSVVHWARAGAPLDEEGLEKAFAYSRYHNPHPPFLKITNAAVMWPSRDFLPFPYSYRVAYHLIDAALLLIAFLALRASASFAQAALLIAFVALQPRILCELVVGTMDGTTLAVWLAMPLAVWRATDPDGAGRGSWWLVAAGVYGIAVATKFTAALVAIPVAAYLAARRDALALCRLIIVVAAGFVFLVATSPDAWDEPLTAIFEYCAYPFRRRSIPISTAYFGQSYKFDLPWSYFAVMSLVTFPVALWLWLPSAVLARRAKHDVLFPALFTVGLWMVVGNLPNTPKHDGVRQFVAVYPWLALLAWRGVVGLRDRMGPARYRVVVAITVTAMLAELWMAHPRERSFYNAFIGGLAGAEDAGMEMTYDFDVFDDEFLSALDQKLPRDSKVLVVPNWPDILRLRQEVGSLRRDLKIINRGAERPDFIAVLRRRSSVDDKAYRDLVTVFDVKHRGVSLAKLASGLGDAPLSRSVRTE